MMRSARVRIAVAVVVLIAMVAVAVPYAQRSYGRRQTYYSEVNYDGRFTFVRMRYEEGLRGFRSRGSRGEPPWAHDYWYGEQNFMKILASVSNVPANLDETSVMTFDNPNLFKFPVIYLVEPGFWYLGDEEVKNLRAYLQKGGFLIVDDFPDRAWPNFEQQMGRVFPEAQWIELDKAHPIFDTFFQVDPAVVPQAYDLGYRPIFYALFEDNDPTKRMLVVANYQNDLSEFWEYSDQGRFFVTETNEAYKVGVNQFIYGITR